MPRLDHLLAYGESRRGLVVFAAVILIAVIAWLDYIIPTTSVGFLYLIPILLCSAALSQTAILALAVVCAYLREAGDPVQQYLAAGGPPPYTLNPAQWAPGWLGRCLVSVAGFAMTGLFVTQLNQRRRMLSEHLAERERQIKLREEAERQLDVLIETSPLAIMTLDPAGCVLLANHSAHQLLGLGADGLHGRPVGPYIPLLPRMLKGHAGANMRTSVECRGQRANGEIFLAHVWLSTYPASPGTQLAAVVWDASENLRDREGAGLDSMMATSRVLVGAIAHEIRNLASATSLAYASLGASASEVRQNPHYQVIGSLIEGLEKIASTGLRAASNTERAIADLDTVLDETRIVIEGALRDQGVTLTWDVSPGLPLAQADHHGLLQVFVNLVRNSQRALAGIPGGELRISAAPENDLVVVRVSDNGPGVQNPQQLFRPFQPGALGCGLGLYVSRAIVRAHGGELRYEPQQRGCCLAVELWPVDMEKEG